MDDTVSRTSQDSAADEFVVVSTDPKLHITGNGGVLELERKMTEVLSDDSCPANSNLPSMAATDKHSEPADDKLRTANPVQEEDDYATVDTNDTSDRRQSGNSFNNLNTSTNTAVKAGK